MRTVSYEVPQTFPQGRDAMITAHGGLVTSLGTMLRHVLHYQDGAAVQDVFMDNPDVRATDAQDGGHYSRLCGLAMSIGHQAGNAVVEVRLFPEAQPPFMKVDVHGSNGLATAAYNMAERLRVKLRYQDTRAQRAHSVVSCQKNIAEVSRDRCYFWI